MRGLGCTYTVGIGGLLDVCLCCGGMGGVCGEWVGDWTRVGREIKRNRSKRERESSAERVRERVVWKDLGREGDDRQRVGDREDTYTYYMFAYVVLLCCKSCFILHITY